MDTLFGFILKKLLKELTLVLKMFEVSFKAWSVIFKVLFHYVSTWQALMSGGAKTTLGLWFSRTTRSSHGGLPA